MDLKDDYYLAFDRWISATVEWANANCPASGQKYDKMFKRDEVLQRLVNEHIKKESKEYDGLQIRTR